MLRQIRRVILFGAAWVASLLACTRQESPPAPVRPPAPSATAARAAPNEKPVAYDVTFVVQTPPKGDQPGEVVATVKAREGFHVNAEYPTNFQPGENAAGHFEKKRYDFKDNVQSTPCPSSAAETCEVKSAIAFKSSTEGPQKVSGVLAFSVCNPDQCLIEKVPVSAELTLAQ